MELFLASNSPRRKDILDQYGINYTVIKNNLLEEPMIQLNEDPIRYVENCATLKASASKNIIKGS